MRLSAWRQSAGRFEMDHLHALGLASTTEQQDMIAWAVNQERPVMVGLEGEVTILKPMETGDEHLSFEGLYDTALTALEFERMKDHGVKKQEELRPRLYAVNIRFSIEELAPNSQLVVEVPGDDERDAIVRLNASLNRDEGFTEAFMERFIETVRKHPGILRLRLGSLGPQIIDDPAPVDTPPWRFRPPRED